MNEEYLKELYSQFGGKLGYANQEEFANDLKSEEFRTELYKQVGNKLGYQDIKEFDSDLGIGSGGASANFTEGSQEPSEQQSQPLEQSGQVKVETPDLTSDYQIDNQPATREEILDNLSNEDFLTKVRDGQINVSINNDEELINKFNDAIRTPAEKKIESALQNIDDDESFVDILGRRFMSGLSSINASLMRTPETLYDFAVNGYNLLLEGQNAIVGGLIGEAEMLPTSKELSDKININNAPAEYYEAYAKETKAIDEKYEAPIFESLKQGEFELAALNLGMAITESLPFTLAVTIPSAAGVSAARTFAGISSVMAAGRKQELQEEQGMSESQKNLNAALYGAAEGFEVFFGAGGTAGRAIRDVFETNGKEAATKFSQNVLDNLLKQSPYLAPFSEGIQEVMTTYLQNLTDKITGQDPDKDLTDGLADSFIVGTVMGGGMQSVATGFKYGKELASKKSPNKTAIEVSANPDSKKFVVEGLAAKVEAGDITQEEADRLSAELNSSIDALNQIKQFIPEDKLEEGIALQREYEALEEQKKETSGGFKKFITAEQAKVEEKLLRLAGITKNEEGNFVRTKPKESQATPSQTEQESQDITLQETTPSGTETVQTNETTPEEVQNPFEGLDIDEREVAELEASVKELEKKPKQTATQEKQPEILIQPKIENLIGETVVDSKTGKEGVIELEGEAGRPIFVSNDGTLVKELGSSEEVAGKTLAEYGLEIKQENDFSNAIDISDKGITVEEQKKSPLEKLEKLAEKEAKQVDAEVDRIINDAVERVEKKTEMLIVKVGNREFLVSKDKKGNYKIFNESGQGEKSPEMRAKAAAAFDTKVNQIERDTLSAAEKRIERVKQKSKDRLAKTTEKKETVDVTQSKPKPKRTPVKKQKELEEKQESEVVKSQKETPITLPKIKEVRVTEKAKTTQSPTVTKLPVIEIKTEVSENGKNHAKDLAGVAYELDGGIGLVQGFNLFGKPVYSAYKGGKRTRTDIESFEGDLFSAEEKARLVELKNKLVTQEQEKQNSSKSPFETQGNVAKSDSVPASIKNLVQGILKGLGLSDTKVFIITDKDLTKEQFEKHGLFGTLAPIRSAGLSSSNKYEYGSTRYMSDANAHYIYYDGNLSPKQLFTIISHELGHIVEKVAFKNASTETKNSIIEDYNKWYANLSGKTLQQVVEETRDLPIHELFSQQTAKFDPQRDRYISSFSEWFADNVAKWARTSEKPKGLVEKWFADLVEYFKSIHNYLVKGVNYSESLSTWLDEMYDSNSPLGGITEMSEELSMMSSGKMDKVENALEATSIEPNKGNLQNVVLGVPQFMMSQANKLTLATYRAGKSLSNAARKGYLYLKAKGYDITEAEYKKYLLDQIKNKQNAQEQQSESLREKGKQDQTQRTSDSDMPKGNKAVVQDGKKEKLTPQKIEDETEGLTNKQATKQGVEELAQSYNQKIQSIKDKFKEVAANFKDAIKTQKDKAKVIKDLQKQAVEILKTALPKGSTIPTSLAKAAASIITSKDLDNFKERVLARAERTEIANKVKAIESKIKKLAKTLPETTNMQALAEKLMSVKLTSGANVELLNEIDEQLTTLIETPVKKIQPKQLKDLVEKIETKPEPTTKVTNAKSINEKLDKLLETYTDEDSSVGAYKTMKGLERLLRLAVNSADKGKISETELEEILNKIDNLNETLTKGLKSEIQALNAQSKKDLEFVLEPANRVRYSAFQSKEIRDFKELLDKFGYPVDFRSAVKLQAIAEELALGYIPVKAMFDISMDIAPRALSNQLSEKVNARKESGFLSKILDKIGLGREGKNLTEDRQVDSILSVENSDFFDYILGLGKEKFIQINLLSPISRAIVRVTENTKAVSKQLTAIMHPSFKKGVSEKQSYSILIARMQGWWEWQGGEGDYFEMAMKTKNFEARKGLGTYNAKLLREAWEAMPKKDGKVDYDGYLNSLKGREKLLNDFLTDLATKNVDKLEIAAQRDGKEFVKIPPQYYFTVIRLTDNIKDDTETFDAYLAEQIKYAENKSLNAGIVNPRSNSVTPIVMDVFRIAEKQQTETDIDYYVKPEFITAAKTFSRAERLAEQNDARIALKGIRKSLKERVSVEFIRYRSDFPLARRLITSLMGAARAEYLITLVRTAKELFAEIARTAIYMNAKGLPQAFAELPSSAVEKVTNKTTPINSIMRLTNSQHSGMAEFEVVGADVPASVTNRRTLLGKVSALGDRGISALSSISPATTLYFLWGSNFYGKFAEFAGKKFDVAEFENNPDDYYKENKESILQAAAYADAIASFVQNGRTRFERATRARTILTPIAKLLGKGDGTVDKRTTLGMINGFLSGQVVKEASNFFVGIRAMLYGENASRGMGTAMVVTGLASAALYNLIGDIIKNYLSDDEDEKDKKPLVDATYDSVLNAFLFLSIGKYGAYTKPLMALVRGQYIEYVKNSEEYRKASKSEKEKMLDEIFTASIDRYNTLPISPEAYGNNFYNIMDAGIPYTGRALEAVTSSAENLQKYMVLKQERTGYKKEKNKNISKDEAQDYAMYSFLIDAAKIGMMLDGKQAPFIQRDLDKLSDILAKVREGKPLSASEEKAIENSPFLRFALSNIGDAYNQSQKLKEK